MRAWCPPPRPLATWVPCSAYHDAEAGGGEHLPHDLLVEVVDVHVHHPRPALAEQPGVPVSVVEGGEGVDTAGDQAPVDLLELRHRVGDVLEDVPRADHVERLGVGGQALDAAGDGGDLQRLARIGRGPDRRLDAQDVVAPVSYTHL